MSNQKGDVFTIQSYGNRGDWGHGKVYAQGSWHAEASKHRGINLSAGAAFSTGLSGEAKKAVAATLEAGAEAEAAIALVAAFPLDLFNEAGLVARLQAEAEAAVFFNASLALERKVFDELFRQKLTGLRDLAEVFLDELTIGVGFAGRASFSAEVLAEAALTGNLLPIDDRTVNGISPGFTFSCQFRAGVKAGTGLHFLANFGFSDSQRLLNRLSDKLVGIVQIELDTRADSFGPAARRAMPYCKLFLPLAARTAFNLGFMLTKQGVNEHRDRARALSARSFVSEAQKFLLLALFDAAVDRLRGGLNNQVANALGSLGVSDLQEVSETLAEIELSLVRVLSEDLGKTENWLTVVLLLLDDLVSVLDLPLLDPITAKKWKTDVALLWCAASLLREVVDWNNASGIPFDKLASTTNDSRIAQMVSGGPGPVTLLSITDYLISNSGLIFEQIGELSEDLREALDWLAGVLGVSSDELFDKLLKGLSNISDGDATQLLATVFRFAQPKLLKIESELLDPLAESNPEIAGMIRQIVKPTLTSFIKIIPPGIEALGTEQAARIFREKISATLLQCLSRSLLVSVDILSEKALENAGDRIRTLAREVANFAGTHPKAKEIQEAAKLSPVPLLLTTNQIVAILNVGAATVDHVRDADRRPILTAVEKMISLGLSTGDPDLDNTWNTLDDPSAPPLGDALKDLVLQLKTEAQDLTQFVYARIEQIVENAIIEDIESVSRAIHEAVRDSVQLLITAVEGLRTEISRWVEESERLAGEIERLVGQIAGRIQNLAVSLESQEADLSAAIHDRGWDFVVQTNIRHNVMFQRLSGVGQREALRDAKVIYDSIFNSLGLTLRSPLDVLKQVGSWVEEALNATPTRPPDVNFVVNYVRSKISQTNAADLNFRISVPLVDFGTTAFSAADVRNTVANFVINQTQPAVSSIVSDARDLFVDRQQFKRAEGLRDRAQAELNQKLASGPPVTGQPLAVAITDPAEGTSNTGYSPLRIDISGANLSFVNVVEGVLKRVRVFFNRQEFPYQPDWWSVTPGGIRFDANVLAPHAVLSADLRPIQNLIGHGWNLIEVAAADGTGKVAHQARSVYFKDWEQNPADGTLLHEQGGPVLFVTYGGAKFAISDPTLLSSLGLNATSTRTVTPRALASLPLVPRNGTVLRELHRTESWIIYDGVRFLISSDDELIALGIFSRVRLIPGGSLKGIPLGPRNRMLIQDRGTDEVFGIFGEAALHLGSAGGLRSLGYSPVEVRTVPQGTVAALSKIPRDGTVLKELSQPNPFVIYGGTAFKVVNPMELSALGINLVDGIGVVPNGALTHLPRTPTEGTLLKERDGKLLYVFYGTAKFAIADAGSLPDLGLSAADVHIVPANSLKPFSSIPVDNTLLTAPRTSIEYVVIAGAKFVLARSGAPMRSRKVPADVLAGIPNVPRDGSRLRERSGRVVYEIRRGRKVRLPDPVPTFPMIKIVPDGGLDQIPNG